jgi:hypothetical protein
MIERIREFFRTFLLFELVKGLMLTGQDSSQKPQKMHLVRSMS